MKTLFEAILKHTGAQAPALLKHLAAADIESWADLTKSNLNDLRDSVMESVSASSARTYFAVLKSVIARYEDDVDLPCRTFREILKAKNEKPLKTYLNIEELRRLEAVEPHGPVEELVKYQFLIGAHTGMRISDIRRADEANLGHGNLTYVSVKTGIKASIPCGDRLKGWLEAVSMNEEHPSLVAYNNAIRRLCRRAGINETVKVYKGGKTLTGEKWEFVSSHTARISFATNLADCNVPVLSISRLCGHSSIQMTERYIVSKNVQLNDKAMLFLA